jgi:L-ascorbate metabolism protein UlaG (beta-lactamase superfamily)
VSVHATHIGTATLLLEIDGVRLLTDPVFDAPGRTYGFGWGTSSTHLEKPALDVSQLGALDAVLLSHDQHGDNLDDAGRALLPTVPKVVTTRAAFNRLGLKSAVGLLPFEQTKVGPLTITATPARHGPPGSLPIVGHVIGFIIEGGSLTSPIYISGDTVWFDGVAEVARRYRPGLAFLHLGGVRFPISGPLRYTFNAQEAVLAANALGSQQVVPLHYEGWTHFRQPRVEATAVFEQAGLGPRVKWLERGVRTALTGAGTA